MKQSGPLLYYLFMNTPMRVKKMRRCFRRNHSVQFDLRDGRSAERIDHRLSELLATLSAEQTALVVVSAPDRC